MPPYAAYLLPHHAAPRSVAPAPSSVRVDGLSLRDYFAAEALKGILTNPEGYHNGVELLAEWSYQQADAMLAEREKGGK